MIRIYTFSLLLFSFACAQTPVVDPSSHNEPMIIYTDDLGLHGLSVADLDRSPQTWEAVSDGLRTRALAGMIIEMQ